jgi:hypothetical protein
MTKKSVMPAQAVTGEWEHEQNIRQWLDLNIGFFG